MKFTTKKEAWEYVNAAFPTDYTENTIKTKNAGYPIYDSNLGDDHGYICDLGNRLEINYADGSTENVWIEAPNTFNELDREKRNHTAHLFSVWLRCYTHEVIVKVMQRREEILNNPFTMNLLEELAKREEKEREEFAYSIGSLLENFDTFAQYNPHNHPLTHAGSYRDILYDMYVKG